MVETDFNFTYEICDRFNGHLLPKSLRRKLLINVMLHEALLRGKDYHGNCY